MGTHKRMTLPHLLLMLPARQRAECARLWTDNEVLDTASARIWHDMPKGEGR